MKMNPEVVELLRRSQLSSDGLSLTIPQADYKVYKQLAKVLEIYEGKWNRKAQAILFPHSFAAKMAELCDTGEVNDKKNPLDFFETPTSVIQNMLEHLTVYPNRTDHVLEPSAGRGAIALYLLDEFGIYPECVELDERRREKLRELRLNVVGEDFLELDPGFGYDYIIMNPPFRTENDQHAYITHVMYAHTCLAEGGQLVAIVPEGFYFNNQARIKEFREFVEKHGHIGEQIPAGAFKESGTGVVTRIITLRA